MLTLGVSEAKEDAQDKLWEMLAKTAETEGLVCEKDSEVFLKLLRQAKN